MKTSDTLSILAHHSNPTLTASTISQAITVVDALEDETTPVRTRTPEATSITQSSPEPDGDTEDTSTTTPSLRPTTSSSRTTTSLEDDSAEGTTDTTGSSTDEDRATSTDPETTETWTTKSDSRKSPTKSPTPHTNASKTKEVSQATSDSNTLSGGGEGSKKPLTKWLAIAGGCLAFLLIVMAASAYYRRWNRKRKMGSTAVTYDPTPDVPRDAPRTPTSPSGTSVAATEEKVDHDPQWEDQPLVPPIPSMYQSEHTRSSSLPEPGKRQYTPPSSRPSTAFVKSQLYDPQVISADIRRGSQGPSAIVTAGHSRQFSRPASEVVLDPASGSPQSYERRLHAQQSQLRHNSYASSKYESLRPSSRRTSEAPVPQLPDHLRGSLQ